MDRIYGLPFTRRPHPGYGRQRIPAYEVVKDSIQIVRGCFGGCAFCSLTAHQGRIIQSRSRDSVLDEIRRMAAEPDFSGVVSDLGGPTANMYGMRCRSPEMRREAAAARVACIRRSASCWTTDHGPLVELMQAARRQPGVQAGLRGLRRADGPGPCASPAYIRELARHHTGGLLKVAPEHVDPGRAAADEEAADRGVPGLRASSFARRRPRRARKSTWCPTSWPAIPAAIWRR